MENITWPVAFVLVFLIVGMTLILLNMGGCRMPWEK
jgi:hypothetical protein